MEECEELPPDPARTIEGLRDTGYDFKTAVADIIDNSIAADAHTIAVTINMDYRGTVRVSVADDGDGMNKPELRNAMKYGSQRREDPSSLGKFGLGLKTASTAFCRRLSVLSRDDAVADLHQATWDLDNVVNTGKWQLLWPDPDKDGKKLLEKVASSTSGTVVLWDKIDRLFDRDYKDPTGGHARNALRRIKDDLKHHLSMVYQRFLDDTDDRARNVEISLDDEFIAAWNPFVPMYSDLVAEQTVPVELEDGSEASFTVRAYVLPRREEFPDEETAKEAHITNDRQGIYIYREQRLIHSADWLGMFQKDPHGSLCRVEFSFCHDLDEAFFIDIKKSRIILNETLWTWLRDSFISSPRRAADQRYRKGQKKKAKDQSESAHDSSNSSIGAKHDDLDPPDIRVDDPASGTAEVNNSEGKARIKIKVSNPLRPGQVFIQPEDSLQDGLLWEPAYIQNHLAVVLNTSHPYYQKVYIPNWSSGVTVQGMDSLLWATCNAEMKSVTEQTKRTFEEIRYEISRLLRRLVEDLPEPKLDEADDEST